jgi:hypothetical protein
VNPGVLTLWRHGAEEPRTVLIPGTNTLFSGAALKSFTGIVTFTCWTATRVHLEAILADLGADVRVTGRSYAAALHRTHCEQQTAIVNRYCRAP